MRKKDLGQWEVVVVDLVDGRYICPHVDLN